MSSRPLKFVLLIGAARAVPSDPTPSTSESHAQDSAANDDAALHVRLVALSPSSTTDLANLVTPITLTPSSTPYELTEITPVPEHTPSTSDELTEITPVPVCTSSASSELTEVTPVPVHTSSPQTTSTSSSVPIPTVTESQTPAQSPLTSPSTTISATGQHAGTVIITDWVTVTLPGPGPGETQMPGSETVPITIIPVTYSNSANRRPELPGGFFGGPPRLANER